MKHISATLLVGLISLMAQAQVTLKKITYPNGDIYDGWVNNELPNGKGKMIWSSESTVYDGEWQNGQMEGKGKCIWKNGDIYEGEWHKGQKHGKGKLVYATGRVEEGYWSNGKFLGNDVNAEAQWITDLMTQNNTAPKTTNSTPTQQQPAFSVLYQLDRDANGLLKVTPVIQYLREAGTIDLMIKRLNATFNLSRKVIIRFGHIKDRNAFFNYKGERNIDFGSGMVAYIYDVFAPYYSKPEQATELRQAVADAVVFILFHEVGHCLIDMYNIPVTGNGEISADEFACFLLTSGNDDGLELTALRGALALSTMEGIAWDEHPFGEQRYYNILCKLYGKNPVKYARYLDNSSQAEGFKRCTSEYQQMINTWNKLLGPYLKK